MIRRGVMSVWKAILLVIGSLVGVAGVTTLGLYISGGFNEKIVEPQDIYFSQEVDGQAFYVDSSDYSAEFNTSSDFFMTIGSTTEGVTENEITLSFEGQGLSSGDYIEDGVIKVPKVVSVGTPFKVELVKMYDSSIYADAVVGGNSVLTAKSSNILLDSISARICVDVPVSEFYILPTDETKNQSNTYVVYADTQFSINQIYGPAKSKFLFSDDAKQKLVFYDIQGENLTYSYETQKFSAGENGTGAVTAYTFSNSFYQRQVLAQYGFTYEGMTPAIMESIKTTILADARLAANSKKYKSSTITLQISSATIDSISFVPAGNKYNQQDDRFDAYTNKYLRLTTKSTSVGDATFGVSVTATAGQANTGALLANMGIKLEANSDIKVDGGKIAKVTATSVTIENYDSTKDYTPTENTIYYLLPNTEPQEYDNYYWKISSEEVGTGSLTLNFFTKDQGGTFTNYYTISGFKDGLDEEAERTFNISFTEKDAEEAPAWSDQEMISMLINYDKDGHIIATSKDLSTDIQKTNKWKNNVYQEIRYFIFADNDASAISSEADLEDYFVCTESGTYTKNYKNEPLLINGTTSRVEGYKLYEIAEGMLIATNSFSGDVKVFVATIQTRADGTPIMDGTKYKIVGTSLVRVVKVESTFSIKNIVSENTGVYIEGTQNEDFVVENNKYYIPATSDNIIKLKIALKLNSAADIEKLKRAITAGEAEGGVYFTCVDDAGDETEEYLTLEDFDQDISNSTDEIAIFNGTFAINQQLFESDFSVLDMGTKIRIKLSYNNGKEIQSEVLKLFVGGEKVIIIDGEDEIEIDAFNIYYPQPTNIDWTSKDDASVYDEINVNITSGGQEIEWGSNTFNENAIQQLNNLLIFKLFDQFNREIEQTTAGYQALFVETPEQGEDKILNLNADGNAIASFSSASDQTTTMQVYAYRARHDQIYEYDETGNVTANELKYDKTFTFNVTSEGVERVEYDATTTVNGSSTPSTYAEASNKGAVVIEKYIKFDNNQSNTISLASLIKVWVGESTDPVSDIHFYFDSTYISSLSSSPNNTTGDSARQSLLKMIEITGDDDKTSKDEGYTEIENWLNKKLKSFRFYYPFAQNTTIRLVAKDSAESLFNIYIDLVCIPDVYMRDLVESKNAEWGYADYLVEKDNAISIFADAEYKLDDIIPVYSRSESNAQISWKTILGEKSFDAADQIYWTDQSSLVSLVKDDYKNIYLKIEDTKQFDFANITIFIHKTYFAYKISLRLYINPNIVAVSDDASPVLNANNLFAGTTKLSDFYKIYKATDYINDSANAEPMDIKAWTTANTSTNKYIGIDLENNKFVAESKTLELELGETTSQSFAFYSEISSSLRNIYGTRKYGSTIVKSDTDALCLNFELGYENETNVVNAETTIYKGQECFVFVSGETYSLASDFEVYDGQVYGVVDVDLDNPAKKVVAKLTDRLVSLNGNGFKIKKDFSDGTKPLTIVSNVNVVVFETGDKFVYYNNDVLPNAPEDMKFNYYDDNTDFETLVANYYAERLTSTLGENGYTLLQENDIFQELIAGKSYKVLHTSDNLTGDFASGDVFGFYYDSTKIGDPHSINCLYSVDVSIVEGAQGYVAGLATYEDGVLTINNTESSFADAYIVLKISITKKNSSFDGVVWFYRIKVIPSFTLGTTNYPYAEDSEYLDVYTRGYYSNGAYTIDFDEALDSTNSKYQTEKQRIENAIIIRYIKAEDVKFVAPADTGYFVDSDFNTKEDELADIQEVEFDGENYFFIDGTTTFYIKAEDIKFYVDDVYCYYDEACTKPASEITDETEVFKYAENKYRFALEFAPTKTFSIKTAYVDGVEISPDDFSDYFGYTFAGETLNISPVDDTTPLTIVVARTLSLGGKALIGGENTYALRFNQSRDYVASIQATRAMITKHNERNFSTTLRADGELTTFTINLQERSEGGSIYDNVSEYWAYVTEETEGYFTFEFTEDRKINIVTAESITQDKTFTIVVYTDTQIAFYIDLTIVGDYTITQNITQLDAGSAYRTTLPFGQLFTIKNALNEDVTGYSIAAEENAPCTISGTNITFSHLTEDRLINFTLTISGYNYHFTILVKANFEVKSRSYNNTTPQYGQKSFNITLIELKATFPEFNNNNFSLVDDSGNEINSGEIAIDDIPNVSSSQLFSKTVTLGYFFNNSKVFEADVTYYYTVFKNVEVTVHYPSPAGTELNVEYISTQQSQGSGGVYGEFEDFFKETADFASENRITATKVSAVEGVAGFKYNWLVSITSISNLTIRINGTNYTAQAEGIQGEGTNKDEYAIRFTLSNSYAEGSATFLVSVNGVEVEYNVIVVNGNNFSITTNAPNYASVTDKANTTLNAETIYAEDLASQEKELFAENRILKYTFNSSANSGTTYYLKLENDTTQAVAVAQITADGTTTTKNVDLGQSYQGYTYKGTYTTYVENTKTFSNLIDDAQIYTTTPRLTKRVVATYRNGEEITNGLTLNVADMALTKDDFRIIKNTPVVATINSSDITTGISYNIYLDSYYSISGVADSATSYTTIILNADYAAAHVATTLLTNTSLGISLTEAQMKQYGGSFSLETYGFSTLAITAEETPTPFAIHDALQKESPIKYATGLNPRAGMTLNTGTLTTGDITKNYITISGHSLLDSTKIYDYNIFAQGANNDGNYVMMKLTYSITISTNNTIDISNDILFKVLPSSNLSFKSSFGSSIYSSATNLIEDQRTIATNQTTPYTIQSNGDPRTFYFGNGTQSTNVDINAILARMYNNSASTAGGFDYTFTGNSENWQTSEETTYYVKATDVGTDGIVQAGTSYYDTSTITDETEPVGTTTVAQKATATTTSGVYQLLLNGVTLEDKMVTVQNLVLGERTFYIDATNDFDYKIRFFFKVVGETNPIVSEISSDTLTEGDKLVVGAKYQTITPTTIKIETEDWAVFNSFTYRKFGEETLFANNLMLQGTYNKARIMFTHSDSKTYYKQWSDSTGSPVDVKTIVDSTEWTELDTENRQTFAETDLANKTITLYVKFDVPTGTDSIAPFSAKYTSTNNPAALTSENSEDITQLKNIDTTLQEPAFGTLESNTKSISLTGVKAYAINKSAGGISTASISDYTSNVTKINVKKIEFYYNNELIHAQVSSEASTALITSDAEAFYTGGTNFENGIKYSTGQHLEFEVPTINNGYLFGTGDTIFGVTMKITLEDDAHNRCEVSYLVTIKRNIDTKIEFSKTKLYDGESPVISTEAPNKTSGNVYNDTLEVTLAPGATTTFVITTKDVSANETSSAPITLTNPENYSITRYIGIHANMSGISEIQTSFKINISENTGATFKYNGAEVTNNTDTSIAQYSNSALKLHIASRRELSSNKKSVRLFFLFSDKTSSETTRYQAYKDFEVYPEYLDTTDGGSIVLVNDYYKISHGTDNFYVIPLASWAPNVIRNAQDTGTGIKIGTGDAPAYKFHFEIDTNLGGSAFIDENGTITTAQNIDLQTEKFFVNIYMKVSGTDGNFEDEDGILIERIALALKQDIDWGTATQSAAGVYKEDNNIFIIPAGYSAYNTSGAEQVGSVSTSDEDPEYAFSIDHALTKADLENMFGSDESVSSWTNRNYHVVYTKFDETGTYQYTNNLNGWTFSDTGKWLINVVVTGRNSGTMTQMLHKTIYIYGTASAATEETYIWQTSTAPTLTGFSEISQTDNSLMPIGTFAQEGIYEKLYLNPNPTNGTLKAITWYIYGTSDTTKKVAVNVPTSSFRVSNIISDVGATIYRYDAEAHTMTPVIYETFNDAANASRTIKYVSVVDEGSGKTIKYYEITYYFTSSTTNGITDVVQINDDQLDNIKSKIATRLNVDKSNITLYTIKQNGELETCSEITPDSAYQTYSILAVASGTGITTRYYRYTINLYGYTGTSLEITEYYTNADMAYSLSNLNDEIAGKISDTISDSTAKTFWTFTDGDNTLTAITTEDLSETPISTYYVKEADVSENKVAADTNYYYDSACTQEAGTTTAETTVTQVGDKYTIQAPTIFTYYVRLGINKDFVNKNTSYYSDAACENYVGKTEEKIYTTKAEDDYKITIGSTEYYVKPSDVISEEIRYYKLVVTYTKTSA